MVCVDFPSRWLQGEAHACSQSCLARFQGDYLYDRRLSAPHPTFGATASTSGYRTSAISDEASLLRSVVGKGLFILL